MGVKHVAAPIRDQVLNNLRRAIIEMRFQPGRRLVERELVELTGASRTSVREALRQLSAEGLVETVPHKGTIVARPTVQEATELYDVRALLESLMARRFVERASDQDLKDLRRALGEIEKSDGLPELVAAKDAFYRVMGRSSETVYNLLASLHARVSLLRSMSLSEPGRLKDTVAELREMVEAAERRDVDSAARATQRHVERAGRIALRNLEKQDQGFADALAAGDA